MLEKRLYILELLNKCEKILQIGTNVDAKRGCINTLRSTLLSIRKHITVSTYDELMKEMDEFINYSMSRNSNETEFLEKYDNIANDFAAFKDDYINNKSNKVKISFVIPTARALYAKIAAEAILTYKGDDIEVVVSHNYLNEMTEMDTIEINDKRFQYFRRENTENARKMEMFTYNVLNGISNATGDYVFMLSDKDIIDIRIIPHLISAVQNNRDVSVLQVSRGDKLADEFNGQYQVLSKGDEAVYNASVQFVLTGVIYKKSLIDIKYYYNKINEREYGYLTYPHSYIFTDLCRLGNFISFREPGHYRPKIDYPDFVKNGDQEDLPIYENDVYPYSLENRIKAFQGLSMEGYKNFTDKNLFLKFFQSLTNGYYIMSTENMYIAYPEDKWTEIDLEQNIRVFKKQNERYFTTIIKNQTMLQIIKKIINDSFEASLKRIEIIKQTRKVPS